MTDRRSSQSPRALRDSTNDPERFSRGSVQIEQSPIRKDGGPENAGAWQHQGELATSQTDLAGTKLPKV